MNHLDDDLDTYLNERAAEVRPASVRVSRHQLGPWVRWLRQRGHRRWATVTATDVDAYLLALAGRGIAASSRGVAASAIRCWVRWLLERGKLLRDPTIDVRVPRGGDGPLLPAPLTEEQVAALMQTVARRAPEDLRTRLHLHLLYACGLRSAEAVGLDVTDLDLTERTLLVRDGKGGRSRIMALAAPTVAAAADYLAVRRELLRGPDHGALLLGVSGRRLPICWMQNHLARLSRTIGFRVFPHLLRHSIAVHMLRRGADVRIIQSFLGHADIDMTLKYLRLVPGQLREDYDKAMPIMPVEPPSTDPPEVGPAGVLATV